MPPITPSILSNYIASLKPREIRLCSDLLSQWNLLNSINETNIDFTLSPKEIDRQIANSFVKIDDYEDFIYYEKNRFESYLNTNKFHGIRNTTWNPNEGLRHLNMNRDKIKQNHIDIENHIDKQNNIDKRNNIGKNKQFQIDAIDGRIDNDKINNNIDNIISIDNADLNLTHYRPSHEHLKYENFLKRRPVTFPTSISLLALSINSTVKSDYFISSVYFGWPDLNPLKNLDISVEKEEQIQRYIGSSLSLRFANYSHLFNFIDTECFYSTSYIAHYARNDPKMKLPNFNNTFDRFTDFKTKNAQSADHQSSLHNGEFMALLYTLFHHETLPIDTDFNKRITGINHILDSLLFTLINRIPFYSEHSMVYIFGYILPRKKGNRLFITFYRTIMAKFIEKNNWLNCNIYEYSLFLRGMSFLNIGHVEVFEKVFFHLGRMTKKRYGCKNQIDSSQKQRRIYSGRILSNANRYYNDVSFGRHYLRILTSLAEANDRNCRRLKKVIYFLFCQINQLLISGHLNYVNAYDPSNLTKLDNLILEEIHQDLTDLGLILGTFSFISHFGLIHNMNIILSKLNLFKMEYDAQSNLLCGLNYHLNRNSMNLMLYDKSATFLLKNNSRNFAICDLKYCQCFDRKLRHSLSASGRRTRFKYSRPRRSSLRTTMRHWKNIDQENCINHDMGTNIRESTFSFVNLQNSRLKNSRKSRLEYILTKMEESRTKYYKREVKLESIIAPKMPTLNHRGFHLLNSYLSNLCRLLPTSGISTLRLLKQNGLVDRPLLLINHSETARQRFNTTDMLPMVNPLKAIDYDINQIPMNDNHNHSAIGEVTTDMLELKESANDIVVVQSSPDLTTDNILAFLNERIGLLSDGKEGSIEEARRESPLVLFNANEIFDKMSLQKLSALSKPDAVHLANNILLGLSCLDDGVLMSMTTQALVSLDNLINMCNAWHGNELTVYIDPSSVSIDVNSRQRRTPKEAYFFKNRDTTKIHIHQVLMKMRPYMAYILGIVEDPFDYYSREQILHNAYGVRDAKKPRKGMGTFYGSPHTRYLKNSLPGPVIDSDHLAKHIRAGNLVGLIGLDEAAGNFTIDISIRVGMADSNKLITDHTVANRVYYLE